MESRQSYLTQSGSLSAKRLHQINSVLLSPAFGPVFFCEGKGYGVSPSIEVFSAITSRHALRDIDKKKPTPFALFMGDPPPGVARPPSPRVYGVAGRNVPPPFFKSVLIRVIRGLPNPHSSLAPTAPLPLCSPGPLWLIPLRAFAKSHSKCNFSLSGLSVPEM